NSEPPLRVAIRSDRTRADRPIPLLTRANTIIRTTNRVTPPASTTLVPFSFGLCMSGVFRTGSNFTRSTWHSILFSSMPRASYLAVAIWFVHVHYWTGGRQLEETMMMAPVGCISRRTHWLAGKIAYYEYIRPRIGQSLGTSAREP